MALSTVGAANVNFVKCGFLDGFVTGIPAVLGNGGRLISRDQNNANSNLIQVMTFSNFASFCF